MPSLGSTELSPGSTALSSELDDPPLEQAVADSVIKAITATYVLSKNTIDIIRIQQILCGLTTTGDILCNSLIDALIPALTNGPYTDLATTRGALCGLSSSGVLECNGSPFNFAGTPNVADFPLGEQFLSIQSAETGFAGIGNSSEIRPTALELAQLVLMATS